MGKTTLPGASTHDARHVDANADLQVGAHQDGPICVTSSLRFCRIGFGLRDRGHAGGRLEGVQEFFALASHFHGSSLPFCLIISLSLQ